MARTKKGGYLILKIKHLNGRLFNRYISENGRIVFNAEQGKIISALYDKSPMSAGELSKVTGLANSTLTLMLKRLEEQELIISQSDELDKRIKFFSLTDFGKEQQEIGQEVSQKLSNVFYDGFTDKEIETVENLLERILNNLDKEMEK